jgi:D-alanyl-D-alanine dipeptidase
MLLCITGGCAGGGAFRVPDSTAQLLVVTSESWPATTGKLRLFTRAGAGAWQQEGAAIEVVLGRGGMGVGRGLLQRSEGAVLGGPEKREGDGRSPAGVFSLGSATGYQDPLDAPGARWPYRPANERLRCVDDAKSPLYNQLALAPESGAPPWSSDEHMRRDDDLYAFTVFVEHNTAPATPGGGSCIFLHVWRGPGSTTAGCTAMARSALELLLEQLNPDTRPLLVQLPADVYRRVAQRWKLPPLP